MKTFAALILLTGLSLPALADHKLYEIQHLSGNRLRDVCQLAESMVPGPATVRPVPELKVVHLAGSAADLAKAEEILKRFDVPPPASPQQPQIAFTIYLVRASLTPPAPDPKPRPVPAELESVITEMKRSFGYTSYNLLDEQITPVNGHVQLLGVLPRFYSSSVQAYFYVLDLSNVWLEPNQSVSLGLNFTVKVPYLAGNEVKEGNSGIVTSLHLKSGQKTVVGKVNVHPTADTDVFLVLVANY